MFNWGSQKSSRERRKFWRMPIRWRLPLAGSDKTPASAIAHDVGRGGIRISLPAGYRQGDPVRFGFEGADGEQHILNAEICRLEKTGSSTCLAGLRWLDGQGHEIDSLEAAMIDAGMGDLPTTPSFF